MEATLQQIKKAIQRESNKLHPESHPQVCELRDTNYPRLEQLVLNEIISNKYEEPPSVQAALAGVEGR